MRAVLPRRGLLRRLSTSFYDSQSGRTVTMPTGVQCHLSLSAVAEERRPSALKHLIRRGKPVRGLASVLRATASDADGVANAAQAGFDEVCIEVSSLAEGVAAVSAACERSMLARAHLLPELCADPHDVQLGAAELGDAGSEAILLSVRPNLGEDELREMADLACEVDLVDVPMRARLGLCVAPGAGALELARFAHEELGLLHFASCLAGVQAPRPSDLLQALGVRGPSLDTGALFLAEHVPDAA